MIDAALQIATLIAFAAPLVTMAIGYPFSTVRMVALAAMVVMLGAWVALRARGQQAFHRKEQQRLDKMNKRMVDAIEGM